jgi:L-threonylcarbamoyladenylate synthase
MPQVLEINPTKPQDALIRRAVVVLQAGGVVAFPTETFYGLAVDAMNDEAIEKIFRIKGRAFSNPIALIAGDKSGIGALVGEIPVAAHRLMQAFWPGPLTLLFSASPRISPRLTAGTGKIGIRISSHPIAAGLAMLLGKPITATSANLSGAPESSAAAEVLTSLGDRVDLVIDGGATPGGKGSTLLDITADPPVCLREGAITRLNIQEALKNA